MWPRRALIEAADVCTAKLTAARIHEYHLYGGFRRDWTNSSQKYRLVNGRVAHANRVRLPSYSVIADVDIVTARGQIDSGGGAQRNVAASGAIGHKRRSTDGRIPISRVQKQCPGPGGSVKLASSGAL